jgi:hypothetical protein
MPIEGDGAAFQLACEAQRIGLNSGSTKSSGM